MSDDPQLRIELHQQWHSWRAFAAYKLRRFGQLLLLVLIGASLFIPVGLWIGWRFWGMGCLGGN